MELTLRQKEKCRKKHSPTPPTNHQRTKLNNHTKKKYAHHKTTLEKKTNYIERCQKGFKWVYTFHTLGKKFERCQLE